MVNSDGERNTKPSSRSKSRASAGASSWEDKDSQSRRRRKADRTPKGDSTDVRSSHFDIFFFVMSLCYTYVVMHDCMDFYVSERITFDKTASYRVHTKSHLYDHRAK